MQLLAENARDLDAWMEAFAREHGRPPRILHIGNIANNAYLNAKILNKAGFDCDVIAYDYYHIMGCPEWEEADFDGEIKDQFHPNWDELDLNGFARPRWFAQGPRDACIAYLLARRRGYAEEAERLWEELRWQAAATIPSEKPWKRHIVGARRLGGAALRRATKSLDAASAFRARTVERVTDFFPVLGRLGRSAVPIFAPIRLLFRRAQGADAGYVDLPRPQIPAILITSSRSAIDVVAAVTDDAPRESPEAEPAPVPAPAPVDHGIRALQGAFRDAFPDRVDQLQVEDVSMYSSVLPQWRDLIAEYDAVVGYATDGLFPLLCGEKPYLAYEHGTIRNIPFEQTTQGRLCAITYRLADTALITNCDNIDAARKLDLDNFRFVPHPVNETHASTDAAIKLAAGIRSELGCDFVVFHPSRQHWEPRRHPDWEKGNDILIRGFAAFVRDTCPTAGAVFVEWGAKVAESKRLLKDLGVASRVKWIQPQPNRRMILYVEAADVVADQFYLGAFGSLTPKALLHGCPVMLHLDEDRHRWCLPELPPVINVNTPEAVAAAFARLYSDTDYHRRLIEDGRAWYERHHSSRVIVETFADSIMRALPRHEAAAT